MGLIGFRGLGFIGFRVLGFRGLQLLGSASARATKQLVEL